jgi:single-stranded DNA-specific DHH superfamily exonuclease
MFNNEEKKYINLVITQELQNKLEQINQVKTRVVRFMLSPVLNKANMLKEHDQKALEDKEKAKQAAEKLKKEQKEAREQDKKRDEAFLAWIKSKPKKAYKTLYRPANHHSNAQPRKGGRFTKKSN